MTNFIKQQQAEAREKYKCWHPDCDNNQTITDANQLPDGSWEPVPVQCQYCWTRDELTTQIITNTIKEVRGRMLGQVTDGSLRLNTYEEGYKGGIAKGSNAYRTHLLSVLEEIEL